MKIKTLELAIKKGFVNVFEYPNLTDLQTWLRDKKLIFVEVLTDCTTEPKFCYEIKRFHGNPKNLAEKLWWWETELQYIKYEFFLERTYETALENGLIESFELLEDA